MFSLPVAQFLVVRRTTHMRSFFIILFALSVCGCQTSSHLGQSIVQEVAQYGGHTQSSAAIPKLHGTWSVESADAESFQAHLSGVSFADVQAFMQQAYGNSVVLHDEPGVWYAAKDIGVAIHFYSCTNGVRFTCQRGHAYPLL
jgi:hypothetical protein